MNKLRNIQHVIKKYRGDIDEVAEYRLCSDTHKSIELVKDTFYIDTELKVIDENEKAAFLVISAPGATGKSALARYIAKEYKSIYWDVSKITLGEKTLNGVLVDALGAGRYSSYCDDLRIGKTLLIIDALDEAEMISGRKNVVFLLKDLVSLKSNDNLSFVLLARTDTANFITKYLKNNDASLAYYEIDFFSMKSAKIFIQKSIQRNNRCVSNTLINNYIDAQFEAIKEVLNDEQKSFLGYAPVLETIATAYDSEKNTMRLIESIKKENSGSNIIKNILEELSSREHEKVISALQEKWKGENELKNVVWERVYNQEEQFKYLLLYIIYSYIDSGSIINNSNIPEKFMEDYIEVIQSFLPQHPFVRDGNKDSDVDVDFAGPAFRDYLIVTLENNDGVVDRSEIEDYFCVKHKEVSTLYYDFWKNNNVNIDGAILFDRIYKSFLSKNSSQINTHVSILQVDDDGGLNVCFGKKIGNQYVDDWLLEVNYALKKLEFENLKSTDIDVNMDVHLVNKDNTQIYNSRISCTNLKIESKGLTIECDNGAECIIKCKENLFVNVKPQNIDVYCDDGGVKVFSENIKTISKLSNYVYDFDDENNVGEYFKYIVHNILKYFRKHKKDYPAKDKECIDNRVIGKSESKLQIIKFLLEKNIIYIDHNEPHLYKLNTVNAEQYGIKWGCMEGISNNLVKDFSKWKNNKTS